MTCPICGVRAPHITLGTGDDAMTMVSCDRCSARSWHQHGEVIDLREVLTQAGGAPSPRSAAPGERRQRPIGYASAVELLRAGLTPRHVVAALVKELSIDDRAAKTAVAAAQQALFVRIS